MGTGHASRAQPPLVTTKSIIPTTTESAYRTRSDAAQILALQKTIGNRATINQLQRKWPWSSRASPDSLKSMDKAPSQGDLNAAAKDNDQKIENTADMVITGAGTAAAFKDETATLLSNLAAVNQTPKFDRVFKDWLQDNQLSSRTKIDDLDNDQLKQLTQREVERGGLRTVIGSASGRENMAIAGSAGGSIAAGLGALGAFASMAASIAHARTTDDKWERAFAIFDASMQGLQGGAMAGQAAAGIGSTIASGVATTGIEAAETAGGVMSGITDSLAGLTPMIQSFMAGAHVLGDIATLFKKDSTSLQRREAGFDLASSGVDSLKSFLSGARSLMSAIRTVLDIAGTGASFGSVVPIVGAAINILVQFLDIVMQAIEIAKRAINIHEAKARRTQIRNLKGAAPASSDHTDMLDKLVEINSKRVNRAIRPLVAASVSVLADIASVGGSVVNIIGVATTPAYGAGAALMGVGYGLSATAGLAKVGAGVSGPVASGIRSAKQRGRNFAGNTTATRFKNTRQYLRDHKVFNIDKTSELKKARDVKTAKSIFDLIASAGTTAPLDKQALAEAFTILKATGVDVEAMIEETRMDKRAKMLIEAIRMRE